MAWMAENYQKWLEVAKYDWIYLEMAINCQKCLLWLDMDKNSWKLLNMVGNWMALLYLESMG